MNNIELDRNFEYSKSANCWIGKYLSKNKEFNIEIYLDYYKDSEINWGDVHNFTIQILDKDKELNSLINSSKLLLLDFIKHVPFGINDGIRYRFELSSFFYYGYSYGNVFSNKSHYSSLVFKLFSDVMIECEDPYGNYMVDVENMLITGIRREQI
jgi:superfamily I DNA and/or RNA helicase